MDLDYVAETGVAAIIANLTAVPTAGAAGRTSAAEQQMAPSSHMGATAAAEHLVVATTGHQRLAESHLAEEIVTAASTTIRPLVVSSTGSSPGDLGQRLEEGLRQVEEGLRNLNRSPTVIVVNQPPPPSTSWQPDIDSAVAAGVFVLLLLIISFGCWWLRRFQPESWKRVKSGAWHILKAVALPVSWLLGAASSLLRRIHSSPEEQTGQSAAVAQVRLVYIIVSVVIPLGYSYLHII